MVANNRAVRRHQSLSTFAESRWFSRSYRGAIAVNISRTARDADSESVAPSGAAPTTGVLAFSLTVELPTRCPPNLRQSSRNYVLRDILYNFHFPDFFRKYKVHDSPFRLLVGLEQSHCFSSLQIDSRKGSPGKN